MLSSNPLERRIQFSGLAVALGLLVEGLSLFWARPLAFVLFLGVGGVLLASGILGFLLSLVSKETTGSDRTKA